MFGIAYYAEKERRLVMSHNRKIKGLASVGVNLVCILTLAFGLFSCGKKARIVGEVLDGFGKPLKDVTVSIEGTTFKVTTDGNGKYSVAYVPGKINVLFSKDNYTSATLEFNIATESKLPAQTVTLHKIPSEQGIFLFGDSDYIPLKKGKLSLKSKKFPKAGWGGAMSENNYIVIGEFVSIEKGTHLKFFDNDKNPLGLFKLTDDGVILVRTTFWLGTKDKAQMIKDVYKKIGEHIGIREISLDKGKYAFVALGEGIGRIGSGEHGIFGSPVREPVYIFEVK